MPSYRLRGRVVLRSRARDMCSGRERDGEGGCERCDCAGRGLGQLARRPASTSVVDEVVLAAVRARFPRA